MLILGLFRLRRMIWKDTVPKQRVITLIAGGLSEEIKTGNSTLHTYKSYAKVTNYNIPSLLHVSREPREFSKEMYSVAFAEQMGGQIIWFNWDTDILHSRTARHFATFTVCSARMVPRRELKCRKSTKS